MLSKHADIRHEGEIWIPSGSRGPPIKIKHSNPPELLAANRRIIQLVE